MKNQIIIFFTFVSLFSFYITASEGPTKEKTAKWLTQFAEQEGISRLDKFGGSGTFSVDPNTCDFKVILAKSSRAVDQNCKAGNIIYNCTVSLSEKSCKTVGNFNDIYIKDISNNSTPYRVLVDIKCIKGDCIQAESYVTCSPRDEDCNENEHETGNVTKKSDNLKYCRPPTLFRDKISAEKFKKGMEHMISLCSDKVKDLF